MHPPARILLVIEDDAERESLSAALAEGGFSAEHVARTEVAARLRAGAVDLVLLDIRRDEARNVALLDALRAEQEMASVPVVVLADRTEDADMTSLLEGGADDVIRLPIAAPELRARLRNHLRLHAYMDELAQKRRDAQVVLELTQSLASSLDFRDILYKLVRRIAEVIQVERVSIVLAPDAVSGEPDRSKFVGYVVAASDDAQVSNLRLDLSRYPEIQEVLRTQRPVVIGDVETHPLLDGVRAEVSRRGAASLILLPILWERHAMGVLFLSMAARRSELSGREMSFCSTVANATAIAVRNAKWMQSLRDLTKEETVARVEAERRLGLLERYADLFSSSADGIAALDANGRLLFANPRAFELSGISEDHLGRSLCEFIHPDDLETCRALADGFTRGDYPRAIDIRLIRATTSGETRVCNFSFAPLAGDDGAVLFSFRDVTEERKIARELTRTKEFLESLIAASVDPILASDMSGTVILFNRAAERMYGYGAEDVIGKVHVERLYSDVGAAREVMQTLRSPQHGGIGRLDNFRTEAMNADGERIPIMLSAAMIYEHGSPVATFGILTDLRDRLRIEERLAAAQEQLAVTEKQAIIAELAGTAAHELNQPLTSIMVYAELLRRKLVGKPEVGAAEAILRESERLTDIVRKIGKITRYETKSYVGAQKILDLDRAAFTSEVPPGESRSRGGT